MKACLAALALSTVIVPASRAAEITHVFDGGRMPREQAIPWSYGARSNTTVAVEDGALRVTDDGRGGGQLQFISRSWVADPDAEARVEAEVRVVRCSTNAGVVILAANGRREAALTLFPDRLGEHHEGLSVPVRLDGAFHRVVLVLRGDDLRVEVDGKEVIDRTGTWTYAAHEGRNIVGFGSLSSAATGEAFWRSVRATTTHPDVKELPGAEHVIVYRKPGVYACFPSVARTPEGWIVARFGTRSLRSHIDPTGGRAARISTDGGRTWSDAPETAGLHAADTLRADGNHAFAGATAWRHVPESQRADLEARGFEVRPSMPGKVAYASGARFCVRKPDGSTYVKPWTEIETPPHRLMMAYNQAAVLNLGGGTRLVAVYSETPDERRDAQVLRTTDDGDSWICLPVARGEPDLGFNEPALGTNTAGHVIALLRTAETPRDRGFLYQSTSTDRGLTWSASRNTGMWGYPAHILTLPDGRLLATYGVRRAPMGIRATFSRDGGQTWATNATVVLRADGRGNGSDLGYPITVPVEDGVLLTVYYFNDAENVTHVAATRWRPGPEKR
jgi:hypothetical protein